MIIHQLCNVLYHRDSRKDIEYDNCSYLLSAGNDMTIRYWDITREDINNNEKKSYLINAPNNLTYCNFTKSNFDKTKLFVKLLSYLCANLIIEFNSFFNFFVLFINSFFSKL